MKERAVHTQLCAVHKWVSRTLPLLLASMLLAGLLCLNNRLTSAQSILKGPYLQRVTPTSIVIMWETDNAVPSLVRYRLQGELDWSETFDAGLATLHEVTLTGLSPQASFEYQVSRNGSDEWTPSETFRTAPTANRAFRLAVYGDSRSEPVPHAAVVQSIITTMPDIVLHTGDLVHDGTQYAAWETQFFVPAAELIAHTPFFPVLGNHENNASYYYDLFSLPGNEQWYAITYGPARIIGLDTNVDFSPSSAQYNWLIAELQSAEYAAAAFRLVFLHHPPYTSGNHPGDPNVQTWLVPLFEQYGVDIILAGHNHHYERSLKDGIYYIVTGGGGAPLYGFPNSNPFSQIREQAYHHVTLDIDSRYAMLTAWYTNGTSFDVLILSAAPVIGRKTTLYDGALNNGTPDTQGWLYLTNPAPASATQIFGDGVTTLDTTPALGDQAGYFSNAPIILDPSTGYAIRFTIRILSETHASTDRAGFSVTALSNDMRGIELGFWENEIWAQEGGGIPNLFTHAESASFDTTAVLIPYQLDVLGNMYALSINSTTLLSGTLRDYTAFAGFPDVYDTPNLLFLGDNSSTSQAKIELAYISVITNTALSGRTTVSNSAVTINDIGVFDLDANGQIVTMTLNAGHGVLTVTTGITDGLSSRDVAGNGTSSVVVTGTIGKINATLAQPSPVRYRGNAKFSGTDVVTVTLTDSDRAADSAYIIIDVMRTGLELRKMVNNTRPYPGERITYTIVVTNASDSPIANAVMSDTLPRHVRLAEAIQLDPPDAGIVGPAPLIVTGLTIAPWDQVTVTLAVTVSQNLTYGIQITNTAVLSDPGAAIWVSDTQGIVIDTPPLDLQLGKMVNDVQPRAGDRITYTIVVTNAGDIPATGAVISDTLSEHLTLARSIQLDPPNAGTVGTVPHIVTGLTITPHHQVTVTIVMTVNKYLTYGSQITNTATLIHPKTASSISDTQLISIDMPVTGIHLDKTANHALPRAGERITYTIAVFNASDEPISDAVISDTLSGDLALAEAIQLDPPGAGTVGTDPYIVTGLTVTPWHWITVTINVTVGQNLTYGTQITNTATITYPEATTLVGDRVTITVPFYTYLPVISANSVAQGSRSRLLAGY